MPLAVGGSILICLGSFVAYAAPGDGQTGMVCFPLWGLGGLMGISSVVIGGFKRNYMLFILPLAIISIYSVTLAFKAADDYEKNWESKHSAANAP